MEGHAAADDLVERSTFSFTGTAEEVEASSLAALAPSASTVVVRVAEVLLAPPGFPVRAGDQVTVGLLEANSLKRGERATFFTTGWLYGDGVAVREVGRHEVGPDDARVTVQAAARRLEVRALAERTSRAEVVVVGRVTAVRPLAEARRRGGPGDGDDDLGPGPISEHDPQLHEATIEVQSVEKGAVAGSQVVVQFPASMDVLWYEVPKLHPHQRGVFLLEGDAVTQRGMGAPTARSVVEVRPLDDLAAVRAAIDHADGR